MDDTWAVELRDCYTAENCEYIGYNRRTNDAITLNKPTLKTYDGFKVYDFTKNNYKYLTMWSAGYPETLYIVIINPKRDIVRVLELSLTDY